jgi:uncharacterized protein (TIGR02117 family)
MVALIASKPAWLAVLLLLGLSGCSSAARCYSDADPATSMHSIYVVRRGFHTGIALRADDWPDRTWQLLHDFPHAKYLEFGWGDAAYYQAQEKTIGMTLAAVFWPTESVMEVIGLDTVSTQRSKDYEAVEVPLSDAGWHALVASITDSFSGDTVTPTGTVFTTVIGQSRFYRARGYFYFPRMCNRWTAERLKSASCPIQSWSVVTASRVMREARRFAPVEGLAK